MLGFAACAAFTATALAATPPARRILSLAPNLTEIAYAAGAGSSLVGTVEFSDYPAAAKALPRVGDAWRVDMEQVLALRPDVVLAWPTGTPATTIGRLRQLGLEVVEVPTQSLAEVPAGVDAAAAVAVDGVVASVVGDGAPESPDALQPPVEAGGQGRVEQGRADHPVSGLRPAPVPAGDQFGDAAVRGEGNGGHGPSPEVRTAS